MSSAFHTTDQVDEFSIHLATVVDAGARYLGFELCGGVAELANDVRWILYVPTSTSL